MHQFDMRTARDKPTIYCPVDAQARTRDSGATAANTRQEAAQRGQALFLLMDKDTQPDTGMPEIMPTTQGRMQQKLPSREWALFPRRGARMPSRTSNHDKLDSDVAPRRYATRPDLDAWTFPHNRQSITSLYY